MRPAAHAPWRAGWERYVETPSRIQPARGASQVQTGVRLMAMHVQVLHQKKLNNLSSTPVPVRAHPLHTPWFTAAMASQASLPADCEARSVLQGPSSPALACGVRAYSCSPERAASDWREALTRAEMVRRMYTASAVKRPCL